MDDKYRGDGVIDELLPNAGAEELRKFVQRYAHGNAEFSVALGQWLMGKYAGLVNNAGAYVEEVRKLFHLSDDSCSNYYRHR